MISRRIPLLPLPLLSVFVTRMHRAGDLCGAGDVGGHAPTDVVLAWVLRSPVLSTTVVGATSTEELRSGLGALSVQLDAEAAEELDRIWPEPGEAPQAYAW